MATRSERMEQRIRGAGHGQVGEVSLVLDLGGDDDTTTDEGSPESTSRTPTATVAPTAEDVPEPSPPEPQTAIKTMQATAAAALAPRGRPDPYDLQDDTPEATPTRRRPSAQGLEAAEDELDDLALPAMQSTMIGSVRSVTSRTPATMLEEVSESPVKAPGTGQRRRIGAHEVSSSTMRLQQVMEADDQDNEADPLSSPSEQRTQRARVSLGRTRPSPLAVQADEPDELSPELTMRSQQSRTLGSPELSSPPKQRQAEPKQQIEPEQAAPETSPPPASSPVETAQRLREKKKRRGPGRSAIPEVREDEEPSAAAEEEDEPEATAELPDEPPQKRRRKEKTSPAKQKQGRRKRPTADDHEPTEPADKPAKKPRRKKTSTVDGEDVVIHAQRFTKRRRVAEGEDPDFDIITAEIPFGKRAGVNCVDVLSSMCDDVVESAVQTLQESKKQAADAAARREIQVKTRALEAFQAELQHRFLGHTIYVDHMHSLRQRVKSEQKEKASLRDDIMRIREEREHVAIRKDAIREKHEKRRKEIMSQLGLSSALYDIDLAVDRGRQAADLPPAEEKKADLANLELLVSRLAEQGSSKSDTGGTLGQLREFNAFLERAAVALEGR